MATTEKESPPPAENFILPALGFMLALAALCFVIGYVAMADIKTGGASAAWSLSAIVRALPVLITLGIFHLTVVRRRLGVTSSVGYALVLAGIVALAGPERASVVGFFSLIPLGMLKASGDWESISPSGKYLYFGVLCAFWLVVGGGVVAGYFSVLPMLEAPELLRAPFGLTLMPVEHSSLLMTFLIGAFSVVTLMVIGGVASSNDITRVALLVAPFVFAGLCCLVMCPIMVSGSPTEPWKMGLFGLARVLLVALSGIAVLGGDHQRHGRSLIGYNKLAFLGLLAMVALEVANSFGLLSTLNFA